MQAILEELEKRRQAARMGGGERRIDAQHAKAHTSWLAVPLKDSTIIIVHKLHIQI